MGLSLQKSMQMGRVGCPQEYGDGLKVWSWPYLGGIGGDRPYESLRIEAILGLPTAQKSTLIALGA